MEQEPAPAARRNSMDTPADLTKTPPRSSLLMLLQERLPWVRQVYRQLRGAPVVGLGLRAAKGWTIAGLVASAVAVAAALTAGTLSGGTMAMVGGALTAAGAAVAVGVAVKRFRT